MGWDTQITVIAENTQEAYLDIARLIYEDAKGYVNLSYDSFIRICYRQNDENTVLFYTFERRKYIPYWVIQEISAKYKEVEFTVLGSSPDYLAGPAGLVRISAGEINDSYAFDERRGDLTGHDSETREYLDPDLLLNWFGKGKQEEVFRKRYVEQYPMSWCEGNYHTTWIDFSEEEMAQLEDLIKLWKEGRIKTDWTDIRMAALKAY